MYSVKQLSDSLYSVSLNVTGIYFQTLYHTFKNDLKTKQLEKSKNSDMIRLSLVVNQLR